MRTPLLILCLTVGLLPHVAVQGQTDPNDPMSAPDGRPDRGSNISRPSPLDGRLTQHLWQSRIAAPDPNEDIQTRRSLDKLIRTIRSVTFDENSQAPTFTPPTETPVGTKPETTESDANDQAKSTEMLVAAPTAPTMPPSALPQATLRRLEELLQDPTQVRDPLEMAELLFLSGRVTEAGILYERALALMSPYDATSSQDRAWVLFQLGNCLRETNLAKAKEMYMQLIADYPSSPWTELAKAHGRLITWYQSANPKQLTAPQESPE